jgi:hypothetical protein
MRRSRITAILTFLAFSTIINGQYSGFDLSKYKLPDIRTSRLDFNFNLGNSSSNIFDKYTFQSYQFETKNDYQYFSGVVNLNYYYFRNKDNYQGNFSVDMNYQPDLRTNKMDSNVVKNNSVAANILISNQNKFFNKDRYFFEIDPLLAVESNSARQYQRYSNYMGASQDDYSNKYSKTISAPFAVGHGRIEPVEDARLAIYILEELNKSGRISVLPSDSLVLEMAKEISRIKRERFFDSRIRKIKELQAIDSFLINNNIISSHDISYFAVLNDQWDYASGPAREAGFEVSAGINDEITFDKDHERSFLSGSNSANQFSYINTYVAGLFINIKYAKPISLYWQSSLSVGTSINRDFMRDPKQKDNPVLNYERNRFRSDLSYSLKYLPDSRTTIAFDLIASYQRSSAEMSSAGTESSRLNDTDNAFDFQPGLNVYYYFSPRLRCHLNPYLVVHKSNSDIKYENNDPPFHEAYNYTSKNITLTMIYSFF